MQNLQYHLGNVPVLGGLLSWSPWAFGVALFVIGFVVPMALRAWPERAFRRQYWLGEVADGAVLTPLAGAFGLMAASRMPYDGQHWYHQDRFQYGLLGFGFLVAVISVLYRLVRRTMNLDEVLSVSHLWTKLVVPLCTYWVLLPLAAVIDSIVRHKTWDGPWVWPLQGWALILGLSFVTSVAQWLLNRKGRHPRRAYGKQHTPLGAAYFRFDPRMDDGLFRSANRPRPEQELRRRDLNGVA